MLGYEDIRVLGEENLYNLMQLRCIKRILPYEEGASITKFLNTIESLFGPDITDYSPLMFIGQPVDEYLGYLQKALWKLTDGSRRMSLDRSVLAMARSTDFHNLFEKCDVSSALSQEQLNIYYRISKYLTYEESESIDVPVIYELSKTCKSVFPKVFYNHVWYSLDFLRRIVLGHRDEWTERNWEVLDKLLFRY